jgi:hypothetical protein
LAYNSNQRKAQAGLINRTPAPTAVDNIRNPKGQGYGANGPQPSSVAPGHAVESSLAANLRESSDDGSLGKIIGGAAQHSNIADGLPDISDEQRTISARGYPASHGLKGQQAPLADIGKNSLPKSNGASAAADDFAARRATRA